MACLLAETLGQQDAFDLLQSTLQEKNNADDVLSEVAAAIVRGDCGRENVIDPDASASIRACDGESTS